MFFKKHYGQIKKSGIYSQSQIKNLKAVFKQFILEISKNDS